MLKKKFAVKIHNKIILENVEEQVRNVDESCREKNCETKIKKRYET